MKKITLGQKFKDSDFDFRETCFGICERNGKILLTKNTIKNETAMVGGGVEKGESHEDGLRREFMEESGYKLIDMKELCTIDCYWITKNKRQMESLANFYIVTLSETAQKPTEEGHEAMWVQLEDVEKYLPLPYQKEGFKQFLLR